MFSELPSETLRRKDGLARVRQPSARREATPMARPDFRSFA
jgi:hypothetical protein